MMRNLVLLAVYLGYLGLGAGAAFICGLGYIWIDLFTPQSIAYGILNQFPLSMVMALAALGFYVLTDRKYPPRFSLSMALLIVWIVWVSLTTTWADFPVAAYAKWDWAIKSIIFAVIFPFLFRSRVQIEAVILTILLAISGNLLSFGAKTIISGGGGYGVNWTLASSTSGNFGLNESSTIALVSAALIPLILFLKRHSLFVPKIRFLNLGYAGLIVFAVMTCLGSFARAGLIALFVLGALIWYRSRHKIATLALLLVIGAGFVSVMPGSWFERMSTISNPDGDSSAGTRLAVWKWTIDYAIEHPFGGGFGAYASNIIRLPNPDGTESIQLGRAYHSMYFEVLGEQGFVGLAIFAILLGTFFANMLRLSRRTKNIPELAWLHDLAQTLMMFTLVYMAGGAFVGISFQPLLYYMLALGICASEYYRRCMILPAAVRSEAPPPVAAPPEPPGRTSKRPPGTWKGSPGRQAAFSRPLR